MWSAARTAGGREEAGEKARVLFLCTGNSARSQIAEAWVRHLMSDRLDACSAGTRPRGLDSRAVRVMEEAGVDMSSHESKHVDSLSAREFDLVVTVCDSAREACPLFPGAKRTIHHSFVDPPGAAESASTEVEALGVYRKVRDEIRAFVEGLPELVGKGRGS